jgi:TrmH family RNA methyltransferase
MSAIEQITSIKDVRIVEARALSSASGRARRQKCLLEGEQIIDWALAADLPIERVFFQARLKEHSLLTKLFERNIDCCSVSEGILKKISNTRYLIPFIGVASLKHESGSFSSDDFVIVLDNVRDHGNIGTIVRTARGFGVRHILTTRQDVDLFYKKIIEASRGKVFDTQFKRFDSNRQALDYLKQRGFQIIATSPYGEVLQSAVQLKNKPVALVVGNETDGVSTEILQQADFVVQIPLSSQVESLNVGVAAGISVYEFKLKLVIAMLVKYIQATLGREVNVAGKLIQQALDNALQQVSAFNSTQIILLMILKCDQTMTLDQVSKDTATFGDELQALLQPLLDDGYIQSEVQTTPPTIQLTAKGEQLLGQLWTVFESTEDKILQGFSNQEKRQLVDYLKRIQSNCAHLIEPIDEKKL